MKARLFKLFLILVALYGGGFGYYYVKAQVRYSMVDGKGIAVFTGGSGRIEHALKKVKSGHLAPVLITGVDEKVSEDYLLKGLSEAQKNQVTLDYMAKTTRDNMAVTIAWAEKMDVEKLVLVTSYYHMPRSLMLFSQKDSELQVIPEPIYPGHVPLSFLIREYHKYILTALRIL